MELEIFRRLILQICRAYGAKVVVAFSCGEAQL
jgi:hypothetical protein